MQPRDGQAIEVAFPQQAAQARELAWTMLTAFAAAASILPLWTGDLLPYQDVPQHLASVRVLADFHTPGFGFEKWFELDLKRLQYLGFYLPAAALAKAVGPEAACRLILSLIAMALPASFLMLLDAFGRDRRLAVFAPAVFHTAPLYLGFFNFVESVPAAIAVVALTERELRAPSRSRAVVLAVATPALLWLHPSALAFAIAAAVVLGATSGQPRSRIARALAPYLPSLTLFGAWAVRALASRDGAGTVARTAPYWMPLKERVLDVFRFGNVLAGHTDELFVLALAAIFGTAALVGGRQRSERAYRLPLLAVLTLLAYFAAPFGIGYMGYIPLRALPFLMLLVLASATLAPGFLTSALCTAAVALQIVYGGTLVRSSHAFDREAQAHELSQVLRAAEPGRSLLALIPEQSSHVMQFQSYLHFAAYYELQRGGRARTNFAEAPWTPVRYRRGTEPVSLPNGWESDPERLDLAWAARDEDYLLVRGPASVPGGDFALKAKAGRWMLYQARR